MGGLSSGINTDDIIDKLVKVESQPIKKMESEIKEYSQKKEALGILSQNLSELQKAAKELYGFRATYDDKKAISSNMGLLQATSTKYAEKGIRYVIVDDIAANHKIATDSIEKGMEIPAGKFKIQVGEKSKEINFTGGNIENFRVMLDQNASEFISTSLVNTSENKVVLTLESRTNGKKGEIQLSGEKEFLRKIGLSSGDKKDDLDIARVVFDSKYFYPYKGEKQIEKEDGTLKAAEDGKSVAIKGLLWREYEMPVSSEIKKGTVLEVKTTTAFSEVDKDEESLPFKVELGPDEKTVIKGIELKGYNISRERPIDSKKQKVNENDLLGVGVVIIDGDKRIEEIYPLQKDVKDKQEIPVGEKHQGKKISRIIFYSNYGEVVFSDAQITTPKSNEGLQEPKNVISQAKSAKFRVDGVPMERDFNNGITDAIKGVTLELKGSDPKQTVELKIEHDIDKSVENIKRFVEAYNKYVELNKSLTKSAMTDKADQYEKTKYESGLFVSDMTIIRLENEIKRATSYPYPSQAPKPVKTFSEMGITTGQLNASWEKIKDGKLVIDEDVLRNTIIEKPEGVRQFFGSDNDGDDRIDNGFGFTIENTLEPYVRPGKNMISAKTEQLDDNVKQTKDRIKRKETSLKGYEEKLRKKFSIMEQSVGKTKSQSQWLKQQQSGKE